MIEAIVQRAQHTMPCAPPTPTFSFAAILNQARALKETARATGEVLRKDFRDLELQLAAVEEKLRREGGAKSEADSSAAHIREELARLESNSSYRAAEAYLKAVKPPGGWR